MDREAIESVARLVAQRNNIDAQIGTIVGRPIVAGHLGEWIAAQVFHVDLEPSAVARTIGGRFSEGPLTGRTVNVKL